MNCSGQDVRDNTDDDLNQREPPEFGAASPTIEDCVFEQRLIEFSDHNRSIASARLSGNILRNYLNTTVYIQAA